MAIVVDLNWQDHKVLHKHLDGLELFLQSKGLQADREYKVVTWEGDGRAPKEGERTVKVHGSERLHAHVKAVLSQQVKKAVLPLGRFRVREHEIPTLLSCGTAMLATVLPGVSCGCITASADGIDVELTGMPIERLHAQRLLKKGFTMQETLQLQRASIPEPVKTWMDNMEATAGENKPFHPTHGFVHAGLLKLCEFHTRDGVATMNGKLSQLLRDTCGMRAFNPEAKLQKPQFIAVMYTLCNQPELAAQLFPDAFDSAVLVVATRDGSQRVAEMEQSAFAQLHRTLGEKVPEVCFPDNAEESFELDPEDLAAALEASLDFSKDYPGALPQGEATSEVQPVGPQAAVAQPAESENRLKSQPAEARPVAQSDEEAVQVAMGHEHAVEMEIQGREALGDDAQSPERPAVGKGASPGSSGAKGKGARRRSGGNQSQLAQPKAARATAPLPLAARPRTVVVQPPAWARYFQDVQEAVSAVGTLGVAMERVQRLKRVVLRPGTCQAPLAVYAGGMLAQPFPPSLVKK